MEDWKKYEKGVLAFFQNNHFDAEYQHNVKVMGINSETLRQIDILATGKLAGRDTRCAIECKHWKEKIDVVALGAFINLCQDTQVNMGIIVTPHGFTEAARKMAENASPQIQILILNDEELYEYRLEFNMCEICDPEEAYPLVDFFEVDGEKYEKGNCYYCNATHIRCTECGHIMSEWSGLSDGAAECECGFRYRLREVHIGSGMMEEEITREKLKRPE